MNLNSDTNESKLLRDLMVQDQLHSRGIQDNRILQAFLNTPRHFFIPHVSLEEAYADHPVGIKAGQTISQPFIVALMIQYLDVSHDHRVLEIGSGSGYATALLSQLCESVDAMEVYGELLEDSKAVIDQLQLDNIRFIHKSAWEQIEEASVYDRIVLWASPPRIPEHLFDSLSDKGGVLVTPEGKFDQFVNIYRKNAGKIKKIRKDAVRFVPLVHGTVREIDQTG